jgi:hypothetical protein
MLKTQKSVGWAYRHEGGGRGEAKEDEAGHGPMHWLLAALLLLLVLVVMGRQGPLEAG